MCHRTYYKKYRHEKNLWNHGTGKANIWKICLERNAIWIRYPKWEENQRELDRARSIYERALDVDYKNIRLWLKYAKWK